MVADYLARHKEESKPLNYLFRARFYYFNPTFTQDPWKQSSIGALRPDDAIWDWKETIVAVLGSP